MTQAHRSKLRPSSFFVGEKALHLIFLLLCLAPVFVSSFISTDGKVSVLHIFGAGIPLRGECFFRLVTGYRCPVCGMTRCFSFMSHLNIAAAWQMSHAGVPLYFLCLFEIVYRFLRLVFGRFKGYAVLKAAEAVLIVIVCFCVAFFFAAQFFCPALID